MRTVNNKKQDEETTAPPKIKVQEVRLARTLASEITQLGAKLYDLMEHEVNDRFERGRALR